MPPRLRSARGLAPFGRNRRKGGAAGKQEAKIAGRQAISAQGGSIEQAPSLMSGFHESARLFPANPTPACSNH